MQSDLVLESEGQCFLCNRETTSISPNTEYDVNLNSSTATNKVYSLQSFSRYLKLDIQKVLNKREHLTPTPLSKVDSWNTTAELCDECSATVETFSKVYQDLEKIEIKLTSYLNIIYGKLLMTERNSYDRSIDIKFSEGNELQRKQEVMKELRAEAMKKCSLKLDCIAPRIPIQRLTKGKMTTQRAINSRVQQDKQESLPDNASVPEIEDIVKVEYPDLDSTPGKENANSLSGFQDGAERPPRQTKVKTNQKVGKVPRVKKFSIVRKVSLKSNKRVEKRLNYSPRINPKSGRYRCDICQKEFNTKGYCQRHYQNKHLDARYKCSTCKKEFTQFSQFNRHHATEHLGVRYTCQTCNKDFKWKAGLLEHHKAVHQPQREHRCNICGKEFKLKKILQRHHKNVHLGVKQKRY